MARLRWGVAILALATLAGCAGRPPGTDGSVADDWPALPKPAVVVPPVEVCHDDLAGYAFVQITSVLGTVTKPCTERHLAETVHVGTFTGEAASRVTAPSFSSPEVRAAYADCVTEATVFLGDDYRVGWVDLYVSIPAAAAWTGGARWYRCDVSETNHDVDDLSHQSRSTTLKGALAPGGKERADCFKVNELPGNDVELATVACTAAHNGELAGLYLAPDVPWPSHDEAERLADNCTGVVAKYVGVPNDRNATYRFGYVYYWPTEDDWKRGNRAFSCYLWMSKNATKLMKGAGPAAFPVT